MMLIRPAYQPSATIMPNTLELLSKLLGDVVGLEGELAVVAGVAGGQHRVADRRASSAAAW